MVTEHDLISGHFFFIDLVGLSAPKTSTKTQIKKIDMLHDLIKQCDAYQSTKEDNCIKIATGDGMVMAFLTDPQLPLKLAIQLHEKLAEYNRSKIPTEIIQVRIGLHSGNVYVVKDINGNQSLWGPGIILARRVMDLGDASHILLTERMAKDLMELSDVYAGIIHEIEDFVIKHDRIITVYSAFGENFGNPALPKAGLTQGIRQEITKINKNTLYPTASQKITIKDAKTMYVKHTRTYEIANKSDEAIKDVVHGIGTDVKKTFDQLNIKVYDETNKAMVIDKITMDYPFQKEFTTSFNKPILKNEKGRSYTLEYEVEEPERYYENTFLVDCGRFELTLEFPSSSNFEPSIYEVNQETEDKVKSLVLPTTEKEKDFTRFSWLFVDKRRGQTIRIEW